MLTLNNKKQREYLNTFKDIVLKSGYMPSYLEVANRHNVTASSIHQTMQRAMLDSDCETLDELIKKDDE